MLDNYDPSKDISFRNILIVGKGGTGKSMLTNMMVYPYSRIFSNLNYFSKGKQLNTRIDSIADVKYISHSYEKGIIVVDEAGINMSSRRSLSTENFEFAKILFLGRKKNCDFVFIAQSYEAIDVSQRRLADMVIEMHKINREGRHPLFIAEVKKMIGGKLQTYIQYKIDIFTWMNYYGRTYNTLETSVLKKETKRKILTV